MEKNMSSIRPEALTDKELLQAGYILWNEESGMPVSFQKELMRRCAGLIEKMEFAGFSNADKLTQPKQLNLFED
jgi:hypothetical protein